MNYNDYLLEYDKNINYENPMGNPMGFIFIIYTVTLFLFL